MIELQKFTRSDIETLIGWVDSAEFLVQLAGTSLSHPLNEPQIAKLLLQASGKDPALMLFKAVMAQTGESIGHIELVNIDRENRSAGVARVLVGPKDLRGKGFGTEMMRLILKVGFEQLALHRMYLHVFDFNRVVIACYEKVGFRVEGLFRESHRVGTVYWSVHVMGVLEDEWRRQEREEIFRSKTALI